MPLRISTWSGVTMTLARSQRDDDHGGEHRDREAEQRADAAAGEHGQGDHRDDDEPDGHGGGQERGARRDDVALGGGHGPSMTEQTWCSGVQGCDRAGRPRNRRRLRGEPAVVPSPPRSTVRAGRRGRGTAAGRGRRGVGVGLVPLAAVAGHEGHRAAAGVGVGGDVEGDGGRAVAHGVGDELGGDQLDVVDQVAQDQLHSDSGHWPSTNDRTARRARVADSGAWSSSRSRGMGPCLPVDGPGETTQEPIQSLAAASGSSAAGEWLVPGAGSGHGADRGRDCVLLGERPGVVVGAVDHADREALAARAASSPVRSGV